MDELQQARADWLDALQRNIALEMEVESLKQANFELQMKLITAQVESIILQMTAHAMAGALFS